MLARQVILVELTCCTASRHQDNLIIYRWNESRGHVGETEKAPPSQRGLDMRIWWVKVKRNYVFKSKWKPNGKQVSQNDKRKSGKRERWGNIMNDDKSSIADELMPRTPLPAFLGECRIASARHAYTQKHTHTHAFSMAGIWEIRRKCEREENPQSNNHHYSFLSFSSGQMGIGSDIFILSFVVSFLSSFSKWSFIIQALTPRLNYSTFISSLKTLPWYRDTVAHCVWTTIQKLQSPMRSSVLRGSQMNTQ